MKRVVITGIGALSPIGNSFSATWEGIKAGITGIAPITRFDASALPWKMAGELKGFDAAAFLSSKEIQRLDPFVHYAVAAAAMAIDDAGFCSYGTSRLSSLANAGVVIGSSRGGISTIEKALLRAHNPQIKTRSFRLSPYIMPSTTVSMAASYVAQKSGIKGYSLGISNACASGANAVGEAFRLIRTGYLDIAVAGGTEAPLCRLCIEGYGISGALADPAKAGVDPRNLPRPFSADRDGFVLSEGACILVLEEYSHALKRGASVYGEIAGYSNTTDAYHMTRPDPAGEAAAIRNVLKEAGMNPDDIGHINTHGTATRIGDSSEACAIKTVFGSRASVIPSTAIKSMSGHMLAASSALEIAVTMMSIKEGVIPPTINLAKKDEDCGLNLPVKKQNLEIKSAVSNSFGFGGVNAVIALRDHISFS